MEDISNEKIAWKSQGIPFLYNAPKYRRHKIYALIIQGQKPKQMSRFPKNRFKKWQHKMLLT